MAGSVSAAVILIVLLLVVIPIPMFVIGRRREVGEAWVAFIPIVGPTVVLLWSAEKSGWWWLLAVIPFVNLLFFLWLYFRLPAVHGRTRWWGVPFLLPFVNIVAWYVYAFSLAGPRAGASARPLAAS